MNQKKQMKKKTMPLPKRVEDYINRSYVFTRFGLLNIGSLKASTGTRLPTDELKKRITARFAKEMVDGAIAFT